MSPPSVIENVVRTRLRSLRTTLGLSLDDLAARTQLSPSTISRVETGRRALSLDILVSLARGLQVDLDALLESAEGADDVVIRPAANEAHGRTTWMLSRPDSSTVALKMRLDPAPLPAPRVHPGYDWFFVLEGRVQLVLGERTIVVEAGQAAEFSTMTPHAFAALDAPAELITIVNRDGLRAHQRA
jgi:transcriptional regulator with XRE-family HTH domain